MSAPVSHLFTFGSLLTSCYYLVFHSLVLLDGVFFAPSGETSLFPPLAETVFLLILQSIVLFLEAVEVVRF